MISSLSDVMIHKRPRVAIFGWFVPHYRLGMYRELKQHDEFDFVVCAPRNYPGQFLKTDHEDLCFDFRDIISWRPRFDKAGHCITFQPYAIWSLLTRRYDVMVLSGDLLGLDVWLAALLAPLLRVKLAFWGQGRSRRPSRIRDFFRRFLMRSARAVIVYTDGIRQYWIDQGLPPEKLFVAYNAMDTVTSERLRQTVTEQDLERFQRDKGLLGKKLVVFSGRLQERKKPQQVIMALSQALPKVPDAHAVIIGDGPMKPAMEKLIDELGLRQSVTLAGAVYDEEILARYFLSAKVAMIPSAGGLGIQHAFGYSLPLLLGDNKWTHGPEAELMTDGRTGFYCREDDVQDFAGKLQCLLTDEPLRQTMAAAAYEVIRTKYNSRNMAKGLAEGILYAFDKKQAPANGACDERSPR